MAGVVEQGVIVGIHKVYSVPTIVVASVVKKGVVLSPVYHDAVLTIVRTIYVGDCVVVGF